MKKVRFTEQQIINVLKEAEAGISISEPCRKHGISDASFFVWRKKFGGMSERPQALTPTRGRKLSFKTHVC